MACVLRNGVDKDREAACQWISELLCFVCSKSVH